MVYLLLADGFEEVEALTVVDYVRRAGIELVTVGVTGKVVTGAHDIPVTADIVMEQAEKEKVKMVILPGGAKGTANLKKSGAVQKMIYTCYERDGIVAAICAAPSILGEMGLLQTKQAVCYPGFEDKLKGAVISDEPVVRDGNVITAKSAGVANDFAYAIISALIDEEKAEEIREQVYDC